MLCLSIRTYCWCYVHGIKWCTKKTRICEMLVKHKFFRNERMLSEKRERIVNAMSTCVECKNEIHVIKLRLTVNRGSYSLFSSAKMLLKLNVSVLRRCMNDLLFNKIGTSFDLLPLYLLNLFPFIRIVLQFSLNARMSHWWNNANEHRCIIVMA
jgi:hypothetical protein